MPSHHKPNKSNERPLGISISEKRNFNSSNAYSCTETSISIVLCKSKNKDIDDNSWQQSHLYSGQYQWSCMAQLLAITDV